MRVYLKEFLSGDFKKVIHWVNNDIPGMLLQWAGKDTYSYPLTIEQLQKEYPRGLNTPEAGVYKYKIMLSQIEEMIGIIQLCRFDWNKLTAVMGRFYIGESSFRGKGLGTEALNLLMHIAFENMGLEMIYLNVYEWNKSAIDCYRKLGFKDDLLTPLDINGVNWDNLRMILGKKSWQSTAFERELMDNLIAFTEPFYSNKDLMHDLSHIRRVLQKAQVLAEHYEGQVDTRIIVYSAYFHGFVYNDEAAIRRFLIDEGFSGNEIEIIIKTAKESQVDAVPETLEGKILHDAHLNEGSKAFYITKGLVTGTARGQTLEQTIEFFENQVFGKGICYLLESQREYQDKQDFAREFIEDLKVSLTR